MAMNVVKVKEIDPRLRKANECLAEAKRARPAKQLFDEFWREGELAMLFGASGTGKSLLAMQVADALARGTPLHGFTMPTGWRKVLYVDLSLTDAQFLARYGSFKFPQNLYRGRPPTETDLCDWIKTSVEANGFKVVIVDDLSAVKRTHDGIRETLACMRRLKQLRDELGISILVLADAFEPTDGWVSENDLKRSRILCTVADSVFNIGRTRRPEDGRRITQTRSRGARLFWDSRNAPIAEIRWLKSGLLGLEFDERFTPKMDEEKRSLICNINEHRKAGMTFRAIAAELGISKTKAHEFSTRWTPSLQRTMQNAECKMSEVEEDEDEYWDETEISAEASEWLTEECKMQNAECKIKDDERLLKGTRNGNSEAILHSAFSISELATIPFAAGLGRRSIYDFDISWDSYGNEIYVEIREEHTGKPTVWYQIDRQGSTRRFKRGMFGIQVEHLNTGPFL